ncbi:MAG: hypothetical protein H5T86_00400 [Armatimonadetes bacterium]|nr:hypothetical protein [Armatimonadota bacterium]
MASGKLLGVCEAGRAKVGGLVVPEQHNVGGGGGGDSGLGEKMLWRGGTSDDR